MDISIERLHQFIDDLEAQYQLGQDLSGQWAAWYRIVHLYGLRKETGHG